MPKMNLIGQKFGRLMVLKQVIENDKKLWLCKCDCGETTKVSTKNLNSGRVRSCGCMKRKSGTTLTSTLCIQCAKATPLLCQWINIGDRTGIKFETRESKQDSPISVVKCSDYVPGPLPPIAWNGREYHLQAMC